MAYNANDIPKIPGVVIDRTAAIRIATALGWAPKEEPKCNPHPKAPHGFNRNASHSEDRYVCECEGWDAYEAGYEAGYKQGLEDA